MGFQIKLNDEPLSMAQLDAEAAAFWGKPVHTKHYATPFVAPEGMSEIDRIRNEMCGNWFDMIGYYIHQPFVEYSSGWDNIKCCLYALHLCNMWKGVKPDIYKPIEIQMEYLQYVANVHLKPYFDLIDHWEAKGYKPYQVKEG